MSSGGPVLLALEMLSSVERVTAGGGPDWEPADAQVGLANILISPRLRGSLGVGDAGTKQGKS